MPLHSFYFHIYKIRYRAIRKAWIVPEAQAQAALLRGALYHAVTESLCLKKDAQTRVGVKCETCSCFYNRFLEPSFPQGYPDARKYAPHVAPYVIYSHIRPGVWEVGEEWTWQLVVFGNANQYLPQLIQLLQRAAHLTGERAGNWELIGVREISVQDLPHQAEPPSYKLTIPEVHNPNLLPTPNVWIKGQATPFEPRYPIGYEHFAPIETDSLSLILLTPLELYQQKELNLYPKPLLFLERLCERITLLSHLYCGAEWNQKSEPNPLVAHWESEHHTGETSWNKKITRGAQEENPGKHFQVKGTQGSIEWKGEAVGAMFPLLQMGQYVHLGKKTVFGQGKYRVYGLDL